MDEIGTFVFKNQGRGHRDPASATLRACHQGECIPLRLLHMGEQKSLAPATPCACPQGEFSALRPLLLGAQRPPHPSLRVPILRDHYTQPEIRQGSAVPWHIAMPVPDPLWEGLGPIDWVRWILPPGSFANLEKPAPP